MEEQASTARSFVLKLGRGLHAHGYPSHRLEAALASVSRRLGLEGQFFSTPTALFASFGGEADQRTYQLRVEPGEQNLGRLAQLDHVTHEVARGRLSPAAGAAQVDAILAAAPPYGPALTTLSFALASASAARFFGGGLSEVAAAAGVGLAIGLLGLVAARSAAVARVFDPLAAALAAFIAVSAALLAGPVSVYTVTLAGLIVLVPGLTLTTAMTELAMRHLMSGTARLAGAGGVFLAIGVGVALGTTVAERLLGEPPLVEPKALPEWTLVLALVAAPLAFVVLLRAEGRDTLGIVAAGVLAFFGARYGAHLVGPELGAFVGALVVGVASNAYARVFERPSAVTLVPGILLLVPGSLGFRSLASLLEQQTLVGIETAFKMAFVAVSLATGLLFANVLLPARSPDGFEA